MPPVYGVPNYDFIDSKEDTNSDDDKTVIGISEVTFYYVVVLISLLLIWILIFFCLRILTIRQKTRSTQQRRTYMGSRQRPSEIQEPTIYVSPSNLPPPPKYEAMAPPSYEEVVGIHYPNYQPHIQPITQPLSTALAQSSYAENSRPGNENTTGNSNTTGNANTVGNTSGNTVVPASTVIPITDNRTTVASS